MTDSSTLPVSIVPPRWLDAVRKLPQLIARMVSNTTEDIGIYHNSKLTIIPPDLKALVNKTGPAITISTHLYPIFRGEKKLSLGKTELLKGDCP